MTIIDTEDITDIESKYASNFKRFNVGGIFGGITAGGVNATLYSQSNDFQKALEKEPVNPNLRGVTRQIECELVMDTQQLKSIHQWLGDKIKEYEHVIEPIPSPEEIHSRQDRLGKSQ